MVTGFDVRKNCRQAKEDLSEIDRAGIWVPPISQDVLLTRQDFETLTENVLNSTVDRLASAIDQSGSEPCQVPVLLAGGSSRIPALHRLIDKRLGCPVMPFGDPQFMVRVPSGLRSDDVGAA